MTGLIRNEDRSSRPLGRSSVSPERAGDSDFCKKEGKLLHHFTI
jgi:hypothetical protein